MSTAPSDFSVALADGSVIPVAVRRHPRARRLRLRYDAAGQALRLTLPPRGDLAAARRWVGEQGLWIARQRDGGMAASPVTAGTRLPFGDAGLLIDWRVDAPRTPQRIDDRLVLGGPEAAVARRVGRWLAEQARATLTAESMALAAGAGLALAGVSVGDPRGRWGSCSAAGRIRYSWRLMLAPDFVRASVVAHEVAHLAHLNHGPRFHALAAALLGQDPAEARAWLRRHGPALHRWRFDAA